MKRATARAILAIILFTGVVTMCSNCTNHAYNKWYKEQVKQNRKQGTE